MAILRNGILSTTTGKIGNVVGSTWRGKNVLKTYNPSPRNPRTASQTTQRNSFSFVVKFVQALLSFVRNVNIYTKVNLPAYNIAVSQTLAHLKSEGLTGSQLNLASFKPLSSFDFEITPTVASFTKSAIVITGINEINLTKDVSINVVLSNENIKKIYVVPQDQITISDSASFQVNTQSFGFATGDIVAIAIVIIDKLNKRTSNYKFVVANSIG